MSPGGELKAPEQSTSPCIEKTKPALCGLRLLIQELDVAELDRPDEPLANALGCPEKATKYLVMAAAAWSTGRNSSVAGTWTVTGQ